MGDYRQGFDNGVVGCVGKGQAAVYGVYSDSGESFAAYDTRQGAWL